MSEVATKYFNINGPCVATRHYMLPVLPRLLEVNKLIKEHEYFVLHAPRQSGKTTFIKALADEINSKGKYYALYCSVERLRWQTDHDKAMESIITGLDSDLKYSMVDGLSDKRVELGDQNSTIALKNTLIQLCISLDKPFILFFDEADCLTEDILLSFLSQLREGYINRDKAPFPNSLALIGMRNIRDYKVKIRPEPESLRSSSPFNIATVLTLANFTVEEISTLYGQHTEATGQIFEREAIERAWYWSEGQPWLVNALAKQVIEKDLQNDYARSITKEHIDKAAETLILRRDTHIDSLQERLKEPRVQRVMEPIFTGEKKKISLTDDDTLYCLDLGLIKKEGGPLRPSNPLYAEVMVRSVSNEIQDEIPEDYKGRFMDGQKLDMTALIKLFQEFCSENAEILEIVEMDAMKEASALFGFQAFLQRVVNGGAHVRQEYALGRGSVDICITYQDKKYPIELKVKRASDKKAKNNNKAMEQLYGYMDKSMISEGWLINFDTDMDKDWDEKISWEIIDYKGKTIHVVGC